MPTHNSEKPLVCIIDDDNDLVKLLSMYLAKDYEVSVFRSGLDFLKMVESHQPDIHCLIIDVQMPDINGYELLQKIRTTDNIKATPAVGITAHDELIDPKKYGRHGFDTVLIKPFKLSAINEQIIKVAERTSTTT